MLHKAEMSQNRFVAIMVWNYLFVSHFPVHHVSNQYFSDCFEHKQRQCFKCNFEKTCDGLSYAERNFTDCDVIEMETYESLLSSKKIDLQAKVNAAIEEACEIIKEIKTMQSQMNELIETDPRVTLEVLNGEIRTRQVDPSDNLTASKRENLAFFGLKFTDSRSKSSPLTIGPVPRLCTLVRENLMSGWGFAINVKADGSRSRVARVVHDGAAERAGIKVNDHILEIEHISVAGLNKMEIFEKLTGGKTLHLDLLVIEGQSE